MIAEYQPNLFNHAPTVITEDPYIKLEMHVKDHLNTHRSVCTNWERSDDDIYTWKRNGATIVGLSSYRDLTSASITTEKEIYESGTYWIQLRTLRQPWSGDKHVTLSIDSKKIGRMNTNHQTEHYRYMDCGYVDLKKGKREFKIDFEGKDSWADHLFLYKIDYYSSDASKSRYKIDWADIRFTNNSMGDINMADITMALRGEWMDPNRNPHSRMVFDRTDMINIFLGDSADNFNCRFGGLLVDFDISDDRSQLTHHFADSLINLYRRPNYANYAIGLTPNSDETYTFPLIQTGSALEAIRHMSDTQEMGIMSYGISYPYVFYKNFKTPSDFYSAACSGFLKTLDPALGMRLTYDKVAVDSCGVSVNDSAYVNLFNSPMLPYDAATDNILYIKYIASGSSCYESLRIQFNIEVTMYKAGEDLSDAQTYNILFTGKAGEANIIGQENPVLNGQEQVIKFNLKSALDSYANSSNYFITKIRLTDTITSEQVTQRRGSAITIMEAGAYPDSVNKKFMVTQETSYPYENIVEVLNKLEYVGYVDYGTRRGLDVLCVAPEMNEAAPIAVVSGSNATISDVSYTTKDELRNIKLAHFTYKDGENEETGVSFAAEDWSVVMYGPWETYENYSDIDNQTDADLETQKYVKQNCYQVQSCILKLTGVPLLNPSQYVVSKLMNEYLSGNLPCKTATYVLSKDAESHVEIGVNRPGELYEELMDELDTTLFKSLGIENRRMYDSRSLSNNDFIASGAFVRSGYNG